MVGVLIKVFNFRWCKWEIMRNSMRIEIYLWIVENILELKMLKEVNIKLV